MYEAQSATLPEKVCIIVPDSLVHVDVALSVPGGRAACAQDVEVLFNAKAHVIGQSTHNVCMQALGVEGLEALVIVVVRIHHIHRALFYCQFCIRQMLALIR